MPVPCESLTPSAQALVSWRPRRDSHPRIAVLQTAALLLRHVARTLLNIAYKQLLGYSPVISSNRWRFFSPMSMRNSICGKYAPFTCCLKGLASSLRCLWAKASADSSSFSGSTVMKMSACLPSSLSLVFVTVMSDCPACLACQKLCRRCAQRLPNPFVPRVHVLTL
jgi:hypothetical protein